MTRIPTVEVSVELVSDVVDGCYRTRVPELGLEVIGERGEPLASVRMRALQQAVEWHLHKETRE